MAIRNRSIILHPITMRKHIYLSIAIAAIVVSAAQAQSTNSLEPPRPATSGAGVAVSVAPMVASTTDAKIQPTLRVELSRLTHAIEEQQQGKGPGRSALAAPGTAIGPDMMIRVIISTTDVPATSGLVQRLGGRFDWLAEDIATVRIPLSRFGELADSRDVRSIDGGVEFTPSMLDRSRAAIGADRVQVGYGLNRPYTGKGVIVGIVDSGIDEDHRDFQDATGRTRILYMWDVSDKNGPTPAGFDHGREYTASDINAGVCTQMDGQGHGTHVAGIAAGNGASSDGINTGIAPEADLIIVHGTRAADGNGGFTSDDVIDGCKYIFQRATELGRPAVINLSLGGHAGGHDGRSLYERALTALTGPGRIIVAAAGNEGSKLIHAGATLLSGQAADIPFGLQAPLGGMLIYYDGPGITATVVARDPLTYAPLAYLTPYVSPGNKVEQQPLVVGGVLLGRITIDASMTNDPESGSSVIAVVIDNADGAAAPENILWSVFLGGAGRFDAWAFQSEFSASDFGIVGVLPGDNTMTLGIPASSKKVIAVASCVTKNAWVDVLGLPEIQDNLCSGVGIAEVGSLSCFSSIGPTRDLRNKPEITAPGEAIFSARSHDLSIGAERGPGVVPASSVPLGLPDYQKLEGTSMAAPHVTGAIALLLQRNPNLDYDGVMTILSSSAIHPYPGFVPNYAWGYGVLNIWGAMLELDAASLEAGTSGSEVWTLAPNPTSGTTHLKFTLARPGHVVIEVVDVRGRETGVRIEQDLSDGDNDLVIDAAALPPGTYGCRVAADGGVRVLPMKVVR